MIKGSYIIPCETSWLLKKISSANICFENFHFFFFLKGSNNVFYKNHGLCHRLEKHWRHVAFLSHFKSFVMEIHSISSRFSFQKKDVYIKKNIYELKNRFPAIYWTISVTQKSFSVKYEGCRQTWNPQGTRQLVVSFARWQFHCHRRGGSECRVNYLLNHKVVREPKGQIVWVP